MSNRVNTKVYQPNLTGAASTNIQGIVQGVVGSLSNVIVAKPAVQPVIMTLHGRTPPVGDHFQADQPMFPASVALGDNKFLHYHVVVWTHLFGQEVTDYGCVYTNGDGLRLCFNSRVSLQKFERWWKRYERVFFGDGSIGECYAPLPVSGKLTGYFVEDAPTPEFGSIGGGGVLTGVQGAAGGYRVTPTLTPQTYLHAASHDTISEVLLPDWVMIVRHSSKSVIRMAGGWFFASAKDGIMFKMQSS